jgi:hypothetical protein
MSPTSDRACHHFATRASINAHQCGHVHRVNRAMFDAGAARGGGLPFDQSGGSRFSKLPQQAVVNFPTNRCARRARHGGTGAYWGSRLVPTPTCLMTTRWNTPGTSYDAAHGSARPALSKSSTRRQSQIALRSAVRPWSPGKRIDDQDVMLLRRASATFRPRSPARRLAARHTDRSDDRHVIRAELVLDDDTPYRGSACVVLRRPRAGSAPRLWGRSSSQPPCSAVMDAGVVGQFNSAL